MLGHRGLVVDVSGSSSVIELVVYVAPGYVVMKAEGRSDERSLVIVSTI